MRSSQMRSDFMLMLTVSLGPLSSGQGKLMQFVDPDQIEQSDRVQAASFASLLLCQLPFPNIFTDNYYLFVCLFFIDILA